MFNRSKSGKKPQGKQQDSQAEFVSRRVKHEPQRRANNRFGADNDTISTSKMVNKGVWRPNASINSIEQEKKKVIDKQIKEKNRRIRRRGRVRVTIRVVGLAVVAVMTFLLIGLASKRANISLDNGTGSKYETQLQSSLAKELDGGIFGNLRPAFLRYRSIEGNLKEQRDEIDDVKLHFNIFRMRTEAEFKNNVALVKWIGADGRPTYVNQKGEVFEPPTSFVELFKPLEIGGSGLGAEPGSKVLASSEKLAWAVGVIPVLRSQGIEPTKINIDGQSFKNVEVMLPGVETRLIFSVDEDVTQSGVAAARSIRYIEKSGAGALAAVGYIDVRTPERVVYR